MKQKILYIILMITAFLGRGEMVFAWGENTSYVLPNVSTEYSLGTIATGPTFQLTGPGAKLAFEACKSPGSINGLYIETSVDGESWKESSMINISENESKYVFPWWQEVYNWRTETFEITDVNVRYIRFKTKTVATLTKYYRNINVTRATTLSTTTSLIAFDSQSINASSTKKASISYNNTTYDQEVTGECPAGFNVTKKNVGETGNTEIDITYSSSTPGVHRGTVTLKMNGEKVDISVSGTSEATYNFSAQVSPNNANYGSASASVANASITSSNKSESTTATFNATPNAGYEFVGWGTTENATTYESTANPYQTSITNSAHASTATKKLYAIFRPVFEFSVSAEKIYDHGSVSAEVTEKILGEPAATSQSAEATFIATPNAGCTFEGWYSDSEHTQLVSKNANYTPTVTNNTVGSTANLTLYAWFKCNQAISWANDIQDFNLIQGTTVDCSAKSDKGLTVRYKSSNDAVASVGENGVVTAIAPSNEQVIITAYQEGNDEFNTAAEITRAFYVLQKLQPVFEVSGFSGVNPTLKVGDTPSITLSNVADDFTFSTSDNTVVSIVRNGDVLTLTALKEGTSKVVLSQPANNTHNAASAEYNISVERHQGGLAVSLPEAMKVGETISDFWNTNNNEVAVVVESNNLNVLAYADGILTAVGEGTAIITVSQAENDKWAGESRQQTIIVSKVANTLGISLASLETKVGNGIAVTFSNQNNSETPVMATITEQTLSSEVNEGTDVISYADGVITALNAGTAKITFSQSASTKYEAFTSSTYDITVTKHTNPIVVSLNGGNALSINLKYGATASLAYTSANADTPCLVSRTSGNYTTLTGNTITAGNAAGTDIYEVKQPETHKYEEGYAMFSIRVNNTNEEVGYVLYDETVYSRDVGGVIHTYELSGPGEILYYSADRVTGAIYYHLYAEYSIDGSSWIVAHDNTNIGTSYKDFSCTIPEAARYVRFRNADGGTLNKHIKNVKVPRKTYVRASSDKTNFGTVYTGSSVQATFTVDYSTTNGGNIHVNSNNPNFVVSANELEVSNHSDGTKTFTVTYTPNPDQLGEESALITVSDLFYSQEITLNASADKRNNTLEVIGEQNLKVGDVVDNVYSGKNSDAELVVSMSNEGVVSYDASANRLTAIGEGSATVTLFQNSTDLYDAVTKTILVNVTKIENTLDISIEKNNLRVGEEAAVNLTNKNSDGIITATYSTDGIVNYSDGKITALKAGTTRITLTQAATTAYPSVSESFDISVVKHDQTLQWDNELSGKDFELSIGQTLDTNTAKASSGLTVTYSSSNPAALSVDPSTGKLTALSSGVNIQITATQAGNDMYNEASISRNFTVISKMEATVLTTLSTSENNILRVGGGAVTIGCTTLITRENFAISGESGVVGTTFENNTLTITPLKRGTITVTLSRAEDESYYAIDQEYSIQVLGPSANLTPDMAPVFEYTEYDEITLNRSFSAGYSTLALPFDTNISDFSNDAGAFAAQLSLVTYNSHDGYTLYFKKVDGGNMLANQPYVVNLPSVKETFVWKDITVAEISPVTKTNEHFQGWIMRANYTPGCSMEGNYGIAGGKLSLGGAGSTINAYTAYFIPPTKNIRTWVAILDEWGNATFIGEVKDGVLQTEEGIFGLDGVRQNELRKGINIVKTKDGTVRKVLK